MVANILIECLGSAHFFIRDLCIKGDGYMQFLGLK